MYIKKLKLKMDKSELETFLRKHTKFRLLSKEELRQNLIAKTVHCEEKILDKKTTVYLTYSDDYLYDLDECKIELDKMRYENIDRYEIFKKFFQRYIFR